jgi:hypothetical protein
MEPQFLRRKEAGKYLKEKYGFASERVLGKLASEGGGPIFRKMGSIVLYAPDDLDAWAQARVSETFSSTSEVKAAREAARRAEPTPPFNPQTVESGA